MSGEPAKPNRHIALITTDADFARAIRKALATSSANELSVVEKNVTDISGELHNLAPAAAIVDVNATRFEEIASLQKLIRKLDGRLPIIVITQEFDAAAVRILIQMQVTDFLTKPVSTADLVRACERAMHGPTAREEVREAQIVAFMPAAGGVGCTSLALQTASILQQGRTTGNSTCVVDLNFQQGACAEYLDLDPHFDISEIENNPDRLDWHLLEVMLSRHESGICVLASPVEPMEMRNFDTQIVVRLLDLAAAYFDNVIIDLPRTWFPWTETVLLGSNRVFVISEMTVPCLRHTQRLLQSIEQLVGREIVPQVIINRFEERSGGLKRSDLEQLLGESLAGCIANNYRLVREAVDRGVPLDQIDPKANVISDLKSIVLPAEEMPAGGAFSIARLFQRKRTG